MAKKTSSITNELNRLLAQLNQDGGFTISVLTDSQGLPIAAAGKDGLDSERQSAIVAMIQKTVSQVGNRLGMTEAEEISIYDSLGQRLVCRSFSANSHSLILAVTIPGSQITYRRLTRQAIAAITRIWYQQVD